MDNTIFYELLDIQNLVNEEATMKEISINFI
jgi:hypothetical protein